MSQGTEVGVGLAARKRALLAQLLRDRGVLAPEGSAIPQRPAGDEGALSFAQQRLWFLDQLEPDSPRYNVFGTFRLEGQIVPSALERSLGEIVRRHEALRASFLAIDGEPQVRVQPAGPFALATADLSGLAPAEKAAELQRRGLAEARQPFRLTAGPLLRATLLRLDPTDHVLFLCLHHIASDGWSIGVLTRELWTLYESFREGRSGSLPELPIQYGDYATWQRGWLSGETLEAQLAYWRERLRGLSPLELPTDRPRPPVQSFAGSWRFRALPVGLVDRLRALGQVEGATPFMTFLAALSVLLHRYSGQTDLAVGAPIANRTRAELEGLIGFFANTLVLRTDLSGDPTFRELLGRVREAALGAYAHQDLPFERLVEELRPERHLSRNPLFQVAFVMQNTAPAELRLPGLTVRQAGLDNQVSKFDLTLYMGDSEPGGIGFEYSTDLFDADSIDRLLGHFATLLGAVAQEPDRRVSELPLLTDAERQRLLVDWNATRVDRTGAPATLHGAFEAQVERTPDAVAVVLGEESLSYRELDARSNRLANHLRGLGVGPESRIGVFVERSLELPTALLGVLKAGAAYVPLDPAYPRDRLSFMLEDGQVGVVLTLDRLAPALPEHGARVLGLDGGWAEVVRASDARPAAGAVGENLAYVMYTSGSTGRPKGVMVSHAAILNHMLWAQSVFPLGADDRVLQKTTLNFDASVWECFAPLMAGAQLVLARPEGQKDSAYLVEAMRHHRVSVLKVVPSLLRAILEEPGLAACRSLRLVLCGGEALPVELVRRAAAALPAARLHNLYGPTEAAVDVTSAPAEIRGAAATLPIGRPIHDTRAYVLDSRLEPVPVGVPGELYVGGANLARGYLGRPELTAERFVPDGLSGEAGACLYRTGDRVRYLPDGAIEFLGRLDHQVKVRGFRIELGEIESVLAAHPGVKDVVVVAREDRPGEPRLVAYVVGDAAAADLRAHAQDRLPDYMVPSVVLRLDALPLGPSGKLERASLPVPEEGSRESAGSPPRTPVEEALAGIWERVLGVDGIGAEEDFFSLGGHSLLATRVMAQVRKTFEVELPLRALFEAPTVRGLALRVEEARSGGRAPVSALVPVKRDGGLPLSFAQQRLFFLDRLGEGSAYHVPLALRLQGSLDERALEQSLSSLVARHESLRTRFVSEGGRALQEIEPALELPLARADVALLPEGEALPRARQLVARDLARPFDLGRAPLARATLVRLGPADHVLLLVLHHIVADGWSVGVLARELTHLYRAFLDGEPARLAPLAVQYVDFAVWQREWLSGAVLEEQLSYWRRRLEGAPVLQLPTDRPRSAEQAFTGACEVDIVPAEVAAELKALGQRQGATPFMVLLAAFQVLLARWTGGRDVTVGTPVAGRTRSEVEGLVGFFVNTLVMRADVSSNPTFRELLARVKEAALGAYDHQDVPFERLVEELAPGRDMGQNPLFQVVFAMQNAPAAEWVLPGLSVAPFGLEVETTHFDLELHVAERDGALLAALTYRSDLFEAATIRRMLGHYRSLLAGIGAGDRRVLEIPLVAEAEEQELLREWRETARTYPRDGTLGELFREQAMATPDAVAVVFGEESLSYRELDRRSNQLARHLRELGAGPEGRVGVSVERSLEMAIALVGVVKAGAAYVPLDPSYPAERLSFMVADAGVSILLTQASLRSGLPAVSGAVVTLDEEEETIGRQSAEPLDAGLTAEDLAYVIYTSGSTGQPKGVAVSQRAVVRLVRGTDYIEIGPGDRIGQASNASFDAATFEVWGALLNGARLVGLSRETSLSPVELARELRGRGVSVLFLTTALFNQVAKEAPGAFASLRVLLFGGEAVDPRVVRGVLADGAPGQLLHVYGPTENTTFSTWHRVAAVEEDAVTVPIGRSLANSLAYVLDEGMRPVPVGLMGELYVGGDGLAREYLGRPELTAERFVPDPYSGVAGARLYRTGDRVRQRRDGAIEFLGRWDHQVKLRGFRIELGEIETALLGVEGVEEALALVREDHPGDFRLVAYVVGPATSASLRSQLQERLPDYMVPSAFVHLDALPLTPNGKVDRRALPAPGADEEAEAYEGPRTPVEQALVRIWSEVLRVGVVGIRDNFFELGGDSILSLQIVARANEAGFRLTPRQIFQRQTIAELAAAVAEARATEAEQGLVTGPVPLTPVQQWFFASEPEDAHHFNQAILLDLRRGLSPSVVERAASELERHHDALRMRFTRHVGTNGSGGAPHWTQRCAEAGPSPFRRVDLTVFSEAEQGAVVERESNAAQRSLDLEAGPVWRVVLFDRGPAFPARVLVAVHHLVVDGVSWRVLLEDLETACRRLARGERARLARKTTSFKAWAERLLEHAASEATGAELEYWRGVAGASRSPLPVDHEAGRESNTVASAQVVSVGLGEEETRALLQDVPSAYRTQVGDVLLTAVLEAFHAWTGRDDLLLELEGHGREDLFEDADLSRTVGWFTTLYPVRLQRREGGPGSALMAVKEQLRAVPRRGIGYGLLRYLAGAEIDASAEVSFNYLGQFDQMWSEGGLFTPAPDGAGLTRSERGRRAHLIEVGGAVAGGRLRMDWKYSAAVHDRATVEALARRFEASLRGFIEHCRSGAWGLTPSDFPLAKLDEAALARIVAGRRQVEEVYPLSPMQEGMLFHTLLSPRLYVEVGRYELEGALDANALRRAWERVMTRHAVLRTRFAWEGLERPVQVVERDLDLPWTDEDWTGLGDAEVEALFRDRVRTERERGFELGHAPLWRVCLARVDEGRHRLVWSFHHALLDGWCVPLLLKEVLGLYRSFTGGERLELGDVRPYRDYIAWLAEQDRAAAETYWRRELSGFRAPTPLGVDRRADRAAKSEPGGGEPAETGERLVVLGEDATAQLKAMGRRLGLTLNTLVAGAWSALLGRYSGTRDVLFGVTVSGRPPALPGVEQMVGLFINTLPLRVDLDEDGGLAEWLGRLQAKQVELRQYEFSPLSDVQRWSDVDGGRALFESLLVFENYPVDPALAGLAREPRLRSLGVRETTNYPLVVVAAALGSRLYLRLIYDRRRFEDEAITRLEGHLHRLLEGIGSGAGRLSELPLLSAEEEGRILVEWNATGAEHERERTLLDLFTEQVARTPEELALVCGGESLSYRELDLRSNRLARRLGELGVGPDVRVGVCLERTVELPVALLGALKAGGAYVPLDPAYPAERLAFMLEDSEVAVLVTEERLVGMLPETGARVVCVDRDREEIAGRSADAVSGAVRAENLAYVIYTSGSTGRPKGVAIEHRNTVALLEWARDRFSPEERAEVLASTSVCFDLSVFELFLPLCCGGRVQLVENALALAGAAALSPTLVNTVPSAIAELLRQGKVPGSVRTIVLAGEPLSPRLVKDLYALGHVERVFDCYGPSEDTTYSTWALREAEGPATIGRPIANTQAYVLDRTLRPVPIGVVGELYLGGEGLARGYLKRPELTAEKFVPDPFGGGGGRLYRTGDLARHLPDGRLEFLGRRDHQVKVRGFRIELGEIEAVLGTHAGVKDAVVLVREDVPGDKRLVAYVTAREAAGVPESELRSHLRAKLPAHLVPSAFVLLASLPLSPNGKLDRRALPAPEGRGELDQVFLPPRDALEETIAAAWREVLRVPEVGVHDNFFDLGGHSLALVRLHGQLHPLVQPRTLAMVDLFEHPTVASLAEHLRRAETPVLEAGAVEQERAVEGRRRLGQLRERRRPAGEGSEAAQ